MAVKSLKEGVILNGKSHSYRIDKVLGSGTFGITYLADVLFHNNMTSNTSVKVAIKEFFMKDFNDRQGSSVTIGSKDGFFGKYLEKFIKEADKLSKIKSNGVVKVLEAFKANNTAYYVMQFLPGGSLNSLITDNGYLPEGVALQFSLQIATALEDLHSQKMLHLDLKPSNVMLTGDYKAVLIDFGLSKQYSDNGEPESSTTIGAGTKGYAPIEQANYRDQGDFPVTMDIYAFGATIFKMVSAHISGWFSQRDLEAKKSLSGSDRFHRVFNGSDEEIKTAKYEECYLRIANNWEQNRYNKQPGCNPLGAEEL